MITSATRNSGLSCPKCAGLAFRRHGKHLGIQRYLCKNCGKTFKETVNSPLHWIHRKELMPAYIHTMIQQLSLRAAAKELNLSAATSFRWRHRLLSSLTAPAAAIANAPAGIAQLRTPHSFKGKRSIPCNKFPDSRTLILTSANGSTSLHHLREKNHALETAKWLTCTVPPQSPLASNPVRGITNAVRAAGRKAILFAAEKTRILARTQDTIIQIQDWMARFRGVATKYLHQYWNWFCAEHAATARSFAENCLGHRQLHHYRKILLE